MGNRAKDSVVLLHGLICNDRFMRPLEKRLLAQGYNVLNIDYPSTTGNLSRLAEHIHPKIDQFLEAHLTGKVHFAGHSLGGLLIREYLELHPVGNDLGHVLMMGTPNRGNTIVDWVRDSRFAGLARRIIGPVGDELATQHSHPPLPKIRGSKAGVIAGEIPLHRLLGGEAGDGLVTVASTRLDTPHRHIVVPAEHVRMPSNRRVLDEAVHFIDKGKFTETGRGGARG